MTVTITKPAIDALGEPTEITLEDVLRIRTTFNSSIEIDFESDEAMWAALELLPDYNSHPDEEELQDCAPYIYIDTESDPDSWWNDVWIETEA